MYGYDTHWMTGHGCLLWDGEKKAFLPNSAFRRSSKKNINADIGVSAGIVLMHTTYSPECMRAHMFHVKSDRESQC